MKLLTDLILKCFKNDLDFSYNPDVNGLLEIRTFDENNKVEYISTGNIKENWRDETPTEALARIHEEVDEYLAEDIHDSEVEFEPEEARARMTEYERGHKNAGVKEDEFI